MGTRPHLSEAAILELYRVSLENVEKQSAIVSAMAELGYNSETITEGKNLYGETVQIYDLNKTEHDERTKVFKDFAKKKELLDDTYTLHCKKIKILFKDEPDVLSQLGVAESVVSVYIIWIKNVKHFYKELLEDVSLHPKLERLNLSIEELNAAVLLIAEVEMARASYVLEKGESENATKTKNAALKKLSDWMSDFYAVAKIALDDQPQLLESLGKFVRS